MPSKETILFLQDSEQQQRDLDELVFQIKEKLRVNKAQPPSRSSCTEKNRHRTSPYSIPSRGSKCGCCDSRKCMHRYSNSNSNSLFPGRTDSSHNREQLTDDPYEALQELLKDGDLIKEAVRRLNIGCFRPKDKSSKVFYDSDDERTPYPFNNVEV